jgi:hypothetical protein
MKKIGVRKRNVFLIALPVAACAVAALAATGRTVYYHGQALTQNARQIDGQTYVPLNDVARMLGGRVAARGGGLEIVSGGSTSVEPGGGRTAAGGADEVRGANGSVGDWFFNGYWRFRVNHVDRPDTYSWHYSASSGSDKPKGDNDELVVVDCTIKNGQETADKPILTEYGTSAQKTALTDDQGQSYAPIDFDSRDTNLVPGAAQSFAVIFSVPKDAHLKDMIFTVYSYGASTKATNVRVNLADQ